MRYWPTIAARVPTRSLHLSRGLGVEPAPGLRSQVLPAGRRHEHHPGRRAAGPGALLCARVQPRTPRAACRELSPVRAVGGGPAAAAAQAGAVLARRRRRRALARPYVVAACSYPRPALWAMCEELLRRLSQRPLPSTSPTAPSTPHRPHRRQPIYRHFPYANNYDFEACVSLNKKRSTAARSAAPRVCSPAAALGWPAGALLRLAAKSAAPPGK